MKNLMWVAMLFATTALAGSLKVRVSTRPIGSFYATCTTVTGYVQREGEAYLAQGIKVPVADLRTDNSLRDRYLKDILKNEALAFVDRATAQNGIFQATLKFRGIDKALTGTYVIEGFQLRATFPLTLSEFGFEPIDYLGVKVLDEVKVEVSLPILSQAPQL